MITKMCIRGLSHLWATSPSSTFFVLLMLLLLLFLSMVVVVVVVVVVLDVAVVVLPRPRERGGYQAVVLILPPRLIRGGRDELMAL